MADGHRKQPYGGGGHIEMFVGRGSYIIILVCLVRLSNVMYAVGVMVMVMVMARLSNIMQQARFCSSGLGMGPSTPP